MPKDLAQYMREYRDTPAGLAAMDAQKKRARARQRAYRILASKHANEFEDLFQAELAALLD
jgi:hypothetical protein